MARVTAATDSGVADRGQLIFITALGLAVTFVVLALVVNTTILTGNMATRGDTVDDGWDALRTEADARPAMERIVTTVNRHNDTSEADLEQAFDRSVNRWGLLAASNAARDGAWVNVEVLETTNGSRIQQTAPDRALTDVDDDETWTLVTGSNGLRNFEMNLSRSSLVDPTPADPNASELVDAGAFTIEVGNDTGRWRLFVFRDDGEVHIAVEDAEGSLGPACTEAAGPDDRVAIDLTAGTMEGSICEELAVIGAVEGPVDVSYNRSGNATGSFELIVDRPVSSVDGGQYGPRGSPSAPFVTPAIYDATLEVSYATSDLERVSKLRIAPGEPDG